MTYVDQISLIPHVEVMHYRWLVQMCELGHVTGLVELGRVDLIDCICIYGLLLFVRSAFAR